MKKWLLLAFKYQMVKEVFRKFQDKLDAIALHNKQCESARKIEKMVTRRFETLGKD